MVKTNNIDNDFAPIRKSNVSVKYGDIIQDIKVDHDQSNLLKNIILTSSKKKQRTPVHSPKHIGEHRRTRQQNSNKIQKNVRTNSNSLLVELVESEEYTAKKIKSNTINIPLFRGITKSKQKKFITNKENSQIKSTVLPLILDYKETNYTSHFMNMLKITLLSQSSARSTMNIPNYFRSTCQFIDEILDNVSNFNELKEIILLKSYYDYSNELFERYLIDASKRKKNCDLIIIKLPFKQESDSIDQINEEFVYRGYNKPLRTYSVTNESLNKHVSNHIHDANSIKQSIQKLIETVNDKNKYDKQSNGILFTFDHIKQDQLSTVDKYLDTLYDLLPFYEFPIIVSYNQLVTDELQQLPKHLFHPRIVEAQKLKSFSSFEEEIITLLNVDAMLTNTDCYSHEWNQKIPAIMLDPSSYLYNELEKIYLAGKGPLDGITAILNMISNCTSLKETFNVLGRNIK